MQGCSITLLKLDDEMVRYWDAPVNTPGLRWGVIASADGGRSRATPSLDWMNRFAGEMAEHRESSSRSTPRSATATTAPT